MANVPASDPRSQSWLPVSPALFACGVCALASALRLFEFTAVDLWQDEANEVFLVEGGLRDALARVRLSEMRPPLRFFFLSIWQQGGWGTEYLRLPSLVFSVAAVPLLYLGARRLVREDVARLAAVLMAGASFPLSSAHFCRSYAMDLFVATLAFHAFALVTESPSRRRQLYYAIAITVTGWTSYFAGLLLVLMTCFHLLAARRGAITGRDLVRMYLGPALAMTPLLPLMFEQWGNARENAWHAKGADTWLLGVYLQVLGAGRIKNWTDFDVAQRVTAAACLVLMVFGVRALWRSGGPLVQREPEARLLPLWFVAPSAALWLVSQFSIGVFTIRTMLVYAPAFYALVAAGLARVPGAWLRRALVALFVAANLHGFATTEDLRYISHGSRAAAQSLLREPEGAPIVVHAQHFTWFPMRLYGPALDQRILQGRVPWNWGGAQVPADRLQPHLDGVRRAGGFWFVQKRDHYHHPRERWLGQLEAIATPWQDAAGRRWRFERGERRLWSGIAMTHYRRVPASPGDEKIALLRGELESLRDDHVYPGEESYVPWGLAELGPS